MAGEDPEYLAWLRAQPCAVCQHPPPSEAHHSTVNRGMGQKAPDSEAFPLCHDCHMEFHDARGAFRHWQKDKRRAWQEEQVEIYRGAFVAEGVF